MPLNILEILERGMSTYCETGIGLFHTQPINTISNAAIFVSAYFSYQFVKTHQIKNPIIRLLPLILVVTGVGSILWHGMPNLLTGFADTLPVSAFVLVSFFFLLNKLLPNRKFVVYTLFGFTLIEAPFIFGILPSFNGFVPYSIAFIFGLLIFFGLLKKNQTIAFQFIPVMIMFMLALFFRTIDHTVCLTFTMGTHFIWHILNALVFYLLIQLLVEIEIKEQNLRIYRNRV